MERKGVNRNKKKFADQINMFQANLKDCPPEFVIIMESALFYKVTPSKKYLTSSEIRQSVQGAKDLKPRID